METKTVNMAGIRSMQVLAHRNHNFETWEKQYLLAISERLKPGMVVFDIGAEEGEFSAFAALHGCEMHLFEPSARYWPNIKAVFAANNLPTPRGCCTSFLGNEPRGKQSFYVNNWPAESEGGIAMEGGFGFIEQHLQIPVIKLDDYTAASGAKPDMIMCDVEGAEGLVMQGGVNTLRASHPLVFVEVHDDAAFQRCRSSRSNFMADIKDLGYAVREIDSDHDTHYLFS